MAAPTQNRPPREVVEFAPNKPVTVALKYAQGKTVSSQYGERIMFSLTDGRVMFLDLEVAGQIASLGINVREAITITRRLNGPKDSLQTWEVTRVAGEQPNGTFLVPHSAPTSPDAHSGPVDAASPKPPASATTPAPVSSALVKEANALVDAFALVLERALTTYQGRIKPDEARALLITAYIQRSKLSSVA